MRAETGVGWVFFRTPQIDIFSTSRVRRCPAVLVAAGIARQLLVLIAQISLEATSLLSALRFSVVLDQHKEDKPVKFLNFCPGFTAFQTRFLSVVSFGSSVLF